MRTKTVQNFVNILIAISACAVVIKGQGNKPQTKPDLSGTWTFDRGRSNIGKSGASASSDEVKIIHLDPELKIRRTTILDGQPKERDFTYYTDGRGETNPTTLWLSTNPDSKSPRPSETKSRTRWSGDKIVTQWTIRLSVGSHVVVWEVVDEWKLSADGKTLTQTTRFVFQQDPMSRSIYIPANRPDDKRVYTLVSK